MEFGQPSTGAPQAAIARAHSVLDRYGMGYWESPALKARIARRYADDHGVAVDPDRILLTAGASPALVLALASTFHQGDQVVIARPNYVSYRNTVRALRLSPLEIPCGPETRYQLTAAHLADLEPAPAGVIIASPANPTGTIIPGRDLRAIAAVCRARRIRIISDEIYHALSYGDPAQSLLEFDASATVLNSFSKYYSMAGWRLGWLVVPAPQVERARAFLGNFYLTARSLSQHTGLVAMDCRQELDGHLATYRRNRTLMLDALPDLGLASIAPPDGAFYIYADIGHLTRNSLAFAERLLMDTGVATAPGLDFDPVDGGRFLRFSFAVSTAQVEEAISRLRPWFSALRP